MDTVMVVLLLSDVIAASLFYCCAMLCGDASGYVPNTYGIACLICCVARRTGNGFR
jgi:hypothetical protein